MILLLEAKVPWVAAKVHFPALIRLVTMKRTASGGRQSLDLG